MNIGDLVRYRKRKGVWWTYTGTVRKIMHTMDGETVLVEFPHECVRTNPRHLVVVKEAAK